MVACDSTGAELPNGRWAERFSADGVLITDSAFKVHGIAVQDLRGKPAFAERAQALVDWMEGVRTGAGATAAVLVAHNGNACDFGFLAAEMARAQRALPAALKYTLDTLQSLLMKKLSSPPYSFRFPGLVTALHFTLVWLACLFYWSAMGEPGKNWPSSMASLRRYCVMVIPIALCNPLTVVFNNKALVYVGAGLCAVIGTLSPVAVALLARVFGRVMSRLSWLGVLVAFSGGALIAKTEIHDLDMGDASAAAAIAGIGFALASVGLRAFKIVLMDQLLAPAAYQGGSKGDTKAEETLSPMHVYALQAGPAALVSVMFALSTESVGRAMDQLTPPVVRMISLTSVSAISLNFLGIFSLRDLGASMQQIIGKLNTICTMALSVGLLGETLPAIVLAGSGIVLAGVAIFEHGKRSSPESPTPSPAPLEDKQGSQSDEESHVHGTCGDSEETSRLVLRSAETSKEAERRRAV